MAESAVARAPGENPRVEVLSVGSPGRHASGWFGMVMLIITEAALFLYLQFSYYYLLVWGGAGFLPTDMPSFRLSGPNTVLLLLSSVAAWWGEEGSSKGDRARTAIGLGVAFIMGVAFMAIQGLEWLDKPYRWDSSVYGSLYFTVTGFHMAHVAVGLVILLVLLVWSLMGYFDRFRHAPVAIGVVYWHFVDAVWLTVFFTFYITPYMGGGT